MDTSMYPTPPGILPASAANWHRNRYKAFKAQYRGIRRRCTAQPHQAALIAVAVAHVTQCPYCIKRHTAEALTHGASEAEIMEAGAR